MCHVEDLDSTCSSLCLAYLLQQLHGLPLIPFVNCSTPAVFRMRGELQLALKKYSINVDDLLFRDQIMQRIEEQPDPVLPLFLVDHNELAGTWRLAHPSVRPRVVALIDHHEDAGQFLDASPRIVQTCGSTVSLVLEHLDTLGEGLDEGFRARLEEVKELLLMTIILDTLELTWRVTPLDVKWVGKLLGMAGEDPPALRPLVRPIMEAIDASFIPESKFTLPDLLYKDFKFYETRGYHYGMSVLRTSFEAFLADQYGEDPEALVADVKTFMATEHLCLFVICICVRKSGEHAFYQENGLFCFDGSVELDTLKACLESDGAQFTRTFAVGPMFALFRQDNPIFSRKRIHPSTHNCILQHPPKNTR